MRFGRSCRRIAPGMGQMVSSSVGEGVAESATNLMTSACLHLHCRLLAAPSQNGLVVAAGWAGVKGKLRSDSDSATDQAGFNPNEL